MTNAQRAIQVCKEIRWLKDTYPEGWALIQRQVEELQPERTHAVEWAATGPAVVRVPATVTASDSSEARWNPASQSNDTPHTESEVPSQQTQQQRRGRGRPKGSKNKPRPGKVRSMSAGGPMSAETPLDREAIRKRVEDGGSHAEHAYEDRVALLAEIERMRAARVIRDAPPIELEWDE